jgi:hypothetical protein
LTVLSGSYFYVKLQVSQYAKPDSLKDPAFEIAAFELAKERGYDPIFGPYAKK